MKELQSILHILENTTSGVLATLVKVEGSSYRRVGARLLWHPDGRRVGSISGGCLEDDLVERARLVERTGEAQVVTYDTTSENDLVWGVGLGCHGVVHVLLERIAGLPRSWEIVAGAWAKREAAIIALGFGDEVEKRGLLCAASASGESWQRENLSGLGFSQNVTRVLASRQSHYTDAPPASGARPLPVLWEFLPPPLRLVIFGAGNDAIPLSHFAKELGWRVVIADPRAAYATTDRFPRADEVRVLRPEAAGELPWDPLTVVVIMTHHYRFDLPMLRAVLPLDLPYVGLLGPKKRADQILGELSASGFELTVEQRARFYGPVGLDLGGSSPETVALAITAEIVAVLNKRDAHPLRERTGPIHAPV